MLSKINCEVFTAQCNISIVEERCNLIIFFIFTAFLHYCMYVSISRLGQMSPCRSWAMLSCMWPAKLKICCCNEHWCHGTSGHLDQSVTHSHTTCPVHFRFYSICLNSSSKSSKVSGARDRKGLIETQYEYTEVLVQQAKHDCQRPWNNKELGFLWHFRIFYLYINEWDSMLSIHL